MTFLLYTLITLFIIVCLFLILVVLIQKGRGGGLASAFGGGGGGNTAFGSKTGDVLTWVTSIVFGVFLVLAIGLNLLGEYQQRNYRPRASVAPVAPVSQNAGELPPTTPPLSTDPRPTPQQKTDAPLPAPAGVPAPVQTPPLPNPNPSTPAPAAPAAQQ